MSINICSLYAAEMPCLSVLSDFAYDLIVFCCVSSNSAIIFFNNVLILGLFEAANFTPDRGLWMETRLLENSGMVMCISMHCP